MRSPLDRRQLRGQFTVQESAKLLSNYSFIEKQLMRVLSGWMPKVPEWDAKLNFGRQLYEDSIHADKLRQRLIELRVAPKALDKPHTGLARVVAEVDQATDTLELMVGIYRVIKPQLIGAYSHYLEATSDVADSPSDWLLREVIADEERHVRWGEAFIQSLCKTKEDHARARVFQDRVNDILVKIGGVSAEDQELNSDLLTDDFGENWLAFWQGSKDKKKRFELTGNYKPSVPECKRDENFKGNLRIPRASVGDDPKQELLSRMHKMSNSELGAAEVLGLTIYEASGMPWDFYKDAARQLWDEIRHAEVAQKRLEDLGGYIGMFEECAGGNYERRVSMELPLRIATLGPIEEANLQFDFKRMRDEAIAQKDFETALLYDYVLADETTHVRYTTKWLKWMADGDLTVMQDWIHKAREKNRQYFEDIAKELGQEEVYIDAYIVR